jgi:hypothetical protein
MYRQQVNKKYRTLLCYLPIPVETQSSKFTFQPFKGCILLDASYLATWCLKKLAET